MSQSVYWVPMSCKRQGGYGPRVKQCLLRVFPALDQKPIVVTAHDIPVLRGMRAALEGQDEVAIQEMEDAIRLYGAIRVEVLE